MPPIIRLPLHISACIIIFNFIVDYYTTIILLLDLLRGTDSGGRRRNIKEQQQQEEEEEVLTTNISEAVMAGGWQSHTEVLRLDLTSSHKVESLKQKIRNGRTTGPIKAWYDMSHLIPGASGREPDNFGPVYASCMSPDKCTTDDMWEAFRRLFALPCAREQLSVEEINLSEGGSPVDGGLWERWYIFDSAFLDNFLEYLIRDGNVDVPEKMQRVLWAAHHEIDDGHGGRHWETILVKHTVV